MTAKKTVKALVIVRHWITDHVIRDTVEFDTEIDTTDDTLAVAKVIDNYTAFLCNETKVKKNPEYDWAQAYVKAKTDELTRCYLEVVIVN